MTSWKPLTEIKYFFTPTRFDKSSEIRKAKYKNYNLPILQMMYNGKETTPLRCLVSKRVGWRDMPCFLTGLPKVRFDIDFNHIRQEHHASARAGDSKDKGKYGPSDLFRAAQLDGNALNLYEFACMMPLSQEVHSYVTQDSAKGNITLKNFSKSWWPWVLKKKSNYDNFFNKYECKVPEYDWTIDHLSSIDHPPMRDRVTYETNTVTKQVSPWSTQTYEITNFKALTIVPTTPKHVDNLLGNV